MKKLIDLFCHTKSIKEMVPFSWYDQIVLVFVLVSFHGVVTRRKGATETKRVTQYCVKCQNYSRKSKNAFIYKWNGKSWMSINGWFRIWIPDDIRKRCPFFFAYFGDGVRKQKKTCALVMIWTCRDENIWSIIRNRKIFHDDTDSSIS